MEALTLKVKFTLKQLELEFKAEAGNLKEIQPRTNQIYA